MGSPEPLSPKEAIISYVSGLAFDGEDLPVAEGERLDALLDDVYEEGHRDGRAEGRAGAFIGRRGEIVGRFCKLQREVNEVLEHKAPADCFCGEGGYWHLEEYASDPSRYRNAGYPLDFIERTVRRALRFEAARVAFRKMAAAMRQAHEEAADAFRDALAAGRKS